MKQRHLLDAHMIPRQLHGRAQEILDSGDLMDLLSLVGSEKTLAFVYSNRFFFRQHQCLERCVVSAYIGANMKMLYLTRSFLSKAALLDLFSLCNHETLKAAAQQVPIAEPYRVYRGVASVTNDEGLSWTSSLPVACLFALANNEAGRGNDLVIIEGVMSGNALYFYTDEREEQEFVGMPSLSKRLEISPDRVRELAHQRRKQIHDADEKG